MVKRADIDLTIMKVKFLKLCTMKYNIIIKYVCLHVLFALLYTVQVNAQQTSYSLSTTTLCGNYSNIARLKVDMSISGSTLTYTVRKMSNLSVCDNSYATSFTTGSMDLWDSAYIKSKTYSGGATVTDTYTLPFTSGSRSYYIKNTGLPGLSIGPFTVTATTLQPNITQSSLLTVSPTTANTGQNVGVSFSLRNTGTATGVVSDLTVAIIKNGIVQDEYAFENNISISPGSTYTYNKTRTFSTTGTFQLEARWRINGTWYGEQAFRTVTINTPPLTINGNIVSPNTGAVQNASQHNFFATVSGGISGVAYQVSVEFIRPDNTTVSLPMTEMAGDFPGTFGLVNKTFELSGTYQYRYKVSQAGGSTTYSQYWSISVAPPLSSVISQSAALTVSPTTANTGQNVGVSFSLRNTGTATGVVSDLTVAIIKNGIVQDEYAFENNISISPGSTYTYNKTRTFSTTGTFQLEARWRINGTWYGEQAFRTVTINAPFNLTLVGVTQPPSGIIYKANDTLPISWQSSNQAKYRISLFKGSSLVGEVAPKTVSTAINYLWTVPSSVGGQPLSGTDYRMKVEIWNSNESEMKEAYSPYFGFSQTSVCATIDSDPLFANGANASWKEAALFLIQRAIVDCPAAGATIQANAPIIRQDLAKILYIALWGSPTTASPTDNFPSPYTDLQNTNTGYHRYAKALLYLEYGDGISPFTRDRTHFFPVQNIPRQYALKVFMEGWRIAPSTTVSTPPFADVPLTTDMVRYIDKAKSLGLVSSANTNFEPNTNLMRGDAFIILKRMIEATTTAPKPSTADLNNLANYFIPNNVTPQTMHSAPDLAQGNFNTYAKSAFNIPDIGFALSFEMEYNSYLTEMPAEWTAIEPLGKGWSHNYMAYIYHSLGNEATSSNDDRYIVNWGGTSMINYRTDTLQPETEGVYDQLSISGNVATLTTPTREIYTFQRIDGGTNPFWLISIKDRNNNTLTLNYNATPYTKNIGNRTLTLRNLSEVVVPSGRKLSFTYQNNKLIRVTDPINRQVNIGYDVNSRQVGTFTDAKAYTTTYAYGTDLEAYLLKSVTLPEGNVITTQYDLNRKAKSVSSNGEQTTINFQPQYNNPTAFLRSTVTEKIGDKTTTYTTEYAKNNTLKTYAGPNGHNVGLSYNHAADPTLPTTITDSQLGTTTVGYNTKGNPTSSSWNGLSATIAYQDEIFPREITDANGFKTIITYDGRMNPETVTDAEGYQTRTSYYPNGLAHVITNAAGITTTLSYNQYGNVETVSLPEGISTQTTYDGVSRPERSTNPLGQITTVAYDENDNVTREEFGGATTSYGYDKNDNLRWIRDALQQTTTLNYDALDRLKEQIFNGKTRSWTYLEGVLKTYTSPNGKTFIHDYDDEGKVLSDGYATYNYYADGTLQTITKEGKSITMGYDAQKRPTSVSYDGQTVTYSYDNNGNVLTMTYPGNKVVRYTYYRNNWLKNVTDWNNKQTTYTYYPDGRLKTEELPNGVMTTYTYNTAGRNTSISTAKSGSAPITSYSFTLDKLGQHTSVTVNEPLGAEPPLTNQTQAATFNNNVLATLNGSTTTHDNNGALTQVAALQVSYDDKDMPLSMNATGWNVQYTYDGLKNRRSRTENGVVTKYILDILGMSNVLVETDANYTPKAYYVYGLSLISRIKPDGTTHYYHGDFRGSTIALTDANATITHKYQYAPYGEVVQRQEPANDSQPFLYVGKQGVQYEGKGIHFMRNRYYNDTTGRFLSEDPIWHANLYPYADNNPIMGIDPEGEQTLTICARRSNGIEISQNEFIDATFTSSYDKIVSVLSKKGVIKQVVDFEMLGDLDSIRRLGCSMYVDGIGSNELQKIVTEIAIEKADEYIYTVTVNAVGIYVPIIYGLNAPIIKSNGIIVAQKFAEFTDKQLSKVWNYLDRKTGMGNAFKYSKMGKDIATFFKKYNIR